ncbi:MAG: LytTR family DNA-binding domain-containing protein [Burkholderiaceae bacterium]
MNATALIAEDEPLLAANLQAELARAWPTLQVLANVRHGAAAVEAALAQRPDVVFLDIQMPGMTGLEAAQALSEDWPDAVPLPLIVFVTAYDQYALQAFERAAVDYVLKPVLPERLAQTCARVQSALRQRRDGGNNPAAALEATLAQLRGLLASTASASAPNTSPAPSQLSVIQAAVGTAIHMVPVAEVLYFEAADKYVRVITAEREYLVRTSLRELLPQLDAQRFWQVHRGTVVRADAIATAVRDESGKVLLTLRGHKDKLTASRLYAHLFKAM